MIALAPILTPTAPDALMQIMRARHRNALNAALGRQLAPVPSLRSPWIGAPVAITFPAHIGALPHDSLLALYRYYHGSFGALERREMEAAVAGMIGVKA